MSIQQHKYLFIDRDGTIIREPEDKQIDTLDKLDFLPGVIGVLAHFKAKNYKLIMVSNQDGLGTERFPQEDFDPPHQMMLRILACEGIIFDDILICPHMPDDHCECRKPKVGLALGYLQSQTIDRAHSYVIGDRQTDLAFADNLGIQGIQIGQAPFLDWHSIQEYILSQPRKASVIRNTNETNIEVTVNLDKRGQVQIDTGIGFFDHMLEQLAKHAGISLAIKAAGDLYIDDHHTVEDIGIALGNTMRQALGDKLGINRYGFLLPMDESLVQVALDLSGRFTCIVEADFPRDKVGELSTEMVKHFFYSFAEGLKANLHLTVKGANAHHMVEGAFKGLGRALGQAISQTNDELPTTKGML